MEFFESNCYIGVLPFSPLSLTELCSFWYGLKDLFTLHSWRVSKLSLTVKIYNVTSGRRDVDLRWLFWGD